MLKISSYTLLTVLIVDLFATSGDITMTWLSPIIPKLNSTNFDVNPLKRIATDEEISWIGSLINIGAIVGPLPFSVLAERFGRKIAVLCLAIPHIISYLTLAFSKTIYLFYFARILGGVAVGGGYTLLPMYVAEVAEDSNRGMLSVTLNIFWTFGNFLPYVIGPYLSVMWFNIALACVPTTAFTLFFLVAPETPYFLIKKNHLDKAEESLSLLRSNSDKYMVEKEVEHIKSVLAHDEHGHFSDIFKSRTHLKALGISLFLIISNQLCGINSILFYAEEILAEAGTDLSGDVSAIIFGSFIFTSSFITPFFADGAGRKLLILVSNAGTFLSLTGLGIFFYIKDSTDLGTKSITWLPLVSVVVFIIAFNIGIGPLPWTVSSELFPASVKPIAASLTSSTCWITSFLVTRFFTDLNSAIGKAGSFWFYAASCVLCFILTYFFLPETKGRSFAEIQEILVR